MNVRNKQFDILRAIGILLVVWVHNYQLPIVFFPILYAIPLFFFISGYFFVPQQTLTNKISYIVKKTRRMLIPYLLLNILFGLITQGLRFFGFNLGLELNWQTIFIYPFGTGDQFVLFLAAWFLFNLYFVTIIAGILFQKNHKLNILLTFCFFILMCISLLYSFHKDVLPMAITFSIRTIFGLSFFSLGYMLKVYEPKIKQYLLKPVTLVFLYITFDIIQKNLGDINYDILFGKVNNHIVFIPIVATVCIILMFYIIAYYIQFMLSENSFVYKIGEYSGSIMVWHLTCFFLVNLLWYFLSIATITDISNVYYHVAIEKLWFLYQIPAFTLPVLLGEWYFHTTQKLSHVLRGKYPKLFTLFLRSRPRIAVVKHD